MPRARIAVLFPAFLGGGAEAVALWMLEALKDKYELTLFTFSTIDFVSLDRYYGTQLSTASIKVVSPWKKAPRVFIESYSLFSLRQHLLMRFFKRYSRQFDLAISAFNEMDLGVPGIQYIYFPLFGISSENVRKLAGYPDTLLRRVYHHLCRRISGFSQAVMLQNTTITLSKYVSDLIQQVYRITPTIVYPPVNTSFPDIPWEQRENGFVFVGRLVPDKRVDVAINTLAAVRAKGYDIHLHVVSGSGDPKYIRDIERLLAENASWVSLEQNISSERLRELLAQHRYGIHAKRMEEFGIVVAEMLNAGCIPFVPNSGGPPEIVGERPELIWGEVEEAAEAIAQVLASTALQKELQEYLRSRLRLFSQERFMREIQQIVATRFPVSAAVEGQHARD